ncbi:MAG: hypothetical protein P1V36_01440 [Planctomycetota bacterium]|nr:hypothetical protein [Planctomycetota bacterium]
MHHSRSLLCAPLLVCALLLGACGDDAPPAAPAAGPAPEPAPLEAPPASAPRAGGPPRLTGSPDGEAAQAPAELAPLPAEPPEPAADAVPDTLAAFHARMEQLIAACKAGEPARAEADARELLLPDAKAWFTHAFGEGDERVDGLVKEYAVRGAQVTSLPEAIAERLAAGQTAILTERFIDPADDLATGYQTVALRAMKQPIGLYSLRLMKAEAESGWHLWSFAHVEGRFRFVGTLLALSAGAASPTVRDLGSIRVKDAQEILEARKGAK